MLATITVHPDVPSGHVSAPDGVGVGVERVVAGGAVVIGGAVVAGGMVSVPNVVDGGMVDVVGGVKVEVSGNGAVPVGVVFVVPNGGRLVAVVGSVTSTEVEGSVGNVPTDGKVVGEVVIPVGTVAVASSSFASAYASVPAPIPSTASPRASIPAGPSRRRSLGAVGVGAPHSRQ